MVASSALVSKVVNGSPSLVKSSIEVPPPASNQALIRVYHVSQNPTDVESFDCDQFGDGSVLGCDFVGEVEAVGDGVSKVKKGDVIAGLIWGGDVKGLGGFSQYTLADEQLCFKIPPGLTYTESATVPLAACTAWLALFSKSCLNIRQQQGSDISILIWGGTCKTPHKNHLYGHIGVSEANPFLASTGRFATQIAKIYKFRIIVTSSPRSFSLVRALGADHVLDYYDKDVIAKIKKLAPHLQHALDTVGSDTSPAIVSQALADKGGNLCGIRPGKAQVANIASRANITDVSAWRAFLQEHLLKDISFAPSVSDHELAAHLFHNLPKWLEDGIIKPDSPRVLRGGLDAVQRGFEVDRPGMSLGCKMVYEI